MKVTTISASVRFSKAIGEGSYKTIELGANATLDSSKEDWQEAQSNLYQELGEQLKNLWSARTDGETRINNSNTISSENKNNSSPGCERDEGVKQR